jgi:hypothetical protein
MRSMGATTRRSGRAAVLLVDGSGVREPQLAAAAAGDLDHLPREVGRDQPASSPSIAARLEPRLAGTGPELEHRLSGLWRELPE